VINIVIVNWNSGQQLRECLESIVSTGQGGLTLGRVVVVDNASSDDSLDGLGSLPLQLTIIRNSENRGFGAACNQGAAVCDGNYLLFLNPDTRLFEKSLSVPLTFMEDEAHEDVGICGIQLIDENGHVSRTCSYFPSLARLISQAIGLNKLPGFKGTGMHMAEWDHRSDRSVDQVIGAFFFMRRKVFTALQGFDERFFVYFEEVDVSFRAMKTGWKSVYLTEARAFHLGGGTSQQVKATRLFYSLRSRLMYGFKHFPLWHAWVLVGVTIAVEPASRLLFCVVSRQWNDMRNTVGGYRMLWPELVKIIYSRDKGEK